MLPAELSECGQARGAAKPADEHDIGSERAGFAGQIHKNDLGDVARKFRVGGLAQGGRVNEVGVTPDNFTESGLRAIYAVIAEQFSIGLCLHLSIKLPPKEKSDNKSDK